MNHPPTSTSSGHTSTHLPTSFTATHTLSSNTFPSSSTTTTTSSLSSNKTRQYAHLHAQLAQLNAHLADTENLVRMTAVQAGDIRFLGGYVGALFMGAARVLGEEKEKGDGEGSGVGKKGKEEGG